MLNDLYCLPEHTDTSRIERSELEMVSIVIYDSERESGGSEIIVEEYDCGVFFGFRQELWQIRPVLRGVPNGQENRGIHSLRYLDLLLGSNIHCLTSSLQTSP
jgi:hypothetical protein